MSDESTMTIASVAIGFLFGVGFSNVFVGIGSGILVLILIHFFNEIANEVSLIRRVLQSLENKDG